MKNIRFLTLLTILLTSIWSATAGVQFKFSVFVLDENEGHFSSKTNVIGRVTTIVATSSVKSVSFTIDNAALLKMLANSFNTEFPSTATLDISGVPKRILVMVGTNILFDVSSVFTIQAGNIFILSDSAVSTETIIANQDLFRVHGNYKIGSVVTLRYDDTARVTSDGRRTRFSITGIQTMQGAFSSDGKSPSPSVLTKFNGTGQGTLFNGSSASPWVLTGKFSHVSNSAD
jgi:hypothetical protein